MATILAPEKASLLTYQAYLSEGEVAGRYDIVEGERIPMASPSWEHQEIMGNIYDKFRGYQKAKNNGRGLMAPFDILIRRFPRLQVRQPDVFYISNTRLMQVGGRPRSGPLEVAPELVVEIISESETEERVASKIRDYIAIGVLECWKVYPDTRRVEVLELTLQGANLVATYTENQVVVSLSFPDLTLSLTDIFALD